MKPKQLCLLFVDIFGGEAFEDVLIEPRVRTKGAQHNTYCARVLPQESHHKKTRASKFYFFNISSLRSGLPVVRSVRLRKNFVSLTCVFQIDFEQPFFLYSIQLTETCIVFNQVSVMEKRGPATGSPILEDSEKCNLDCKTVSTLSRNSAEKS